MKNETRGRRKRIICRIAALYPEMFARIAPLSGRIRDEKLYLEKFADMPIYTFVGTADRICPADETIDFIDKLSAINENARVVVLNGAAHSEVPSLTYPDSCYAVVSRLIGDEKQ